MGFLKNLFARPPQEKEEPTDKKPVEMGLGEVLAWVKKTNSAKLEELESDAKAIWSELMNRFSALEKSVKALEKERFEPGDNTYAVFNMLKDGFVKRASKLLNRVPKDMVFTYKFLSESQVLMTSTLKDMMVMSPKQSYSLSNYFSKQISKVVSNIKEIRSGLERFDSFLKSDAQLIHLIEKLEDFLDGYSQEKSEFGELAKKSDELKEDLTRLEGEKKEKSAELGNLLKSDKWREAETFKDGISNLEDEMSGTSLRLKEELSAVKRPFKKMEHEASRIQLVPQKLASLKKFVKSPFKSFMENEENLKMLLGALEKSGSAINLKDRDQSKLKDFSNKVSNGELGKLKKRYEELAAKKAALDEKRSEIGHILDSKAQLERSIEEIEKRTKKTSEEIESNTQARDEAKKSLANAKKEIEDLVLEHLNKKIVIVNK